MNEFQPQSIAVDFREDDPNIVKMLIEQVRQLIETNNDYEKRIQDLENRVLN